jgi:hypothetical protein
MTWVRSAFWLGRPHRGSEEVFFSTMNDELLPCLKALPGVSDASVLWPKRYEDGAPDVFCQILVFFDSEADVERMLTSDERKDMRLRVIELSSRFEGIMTHIDYELSEMPKQFGEGS